MAGTGAGATPVVVAGLPMPCFCNSISTRFFNASNCCRLDGRGCDALTAGAAPAGSCTPETGLPGTACPAASLADDGADWIAPLHTCGPLAPAVDAAGCVLSTADAPYAADAPIEAEAPLEANAPAAVAVETLAPLTGAACTAGATGAGCTAEPGCGADAPCCASAAPPDAAAGAEAAAAPEAADAPAGTSAAPVASSAGTVSVAPTFRRLASRFMNACGLASNNARPARASTAGSCDCVAAFAMSFSDWPGWTVTVSGAAAPAADAGNSPVPTAHADAATPSARIASAPRTARDKRD